MFIELDYLQEDTYFQKMAFQYWKIDEKHHFVYKIADLSLKYQISPKKLLTYVNQVLVWFVSGEVAKYEVIRHKHII